MCLRVRPSLTEDEGWKLDLGQMSMLGLLGTSWDELSGLTPDEAAVSLQPSCLAHDASELSQAMTSPGLHSPELQKMYHEAETLTANIPPAPPPTPVPTPTLPTTSDCTANGKDGDRPEPSRLEPDVLLRQRRGRARLQRSGLQHRVGRRHEHDAQLVRLQD